jgi:hypothetical protein
MITYLFFPFYVYVLHTVVYLESGKAIPRILFHISYLVFMCYEMKPGVLNTLILVLSLLSHFSLD